MKKGRHPDAWNGLAVRQARTKEADVVAGATYTSNGVINTMKKTLENTKL